MERHIPVLLNEVIEALSLKPNANIIDCTLGDGGHSEAILEITGSNGKIMGMDADAESLLRAKRYLYRYGDRVIYVRDNFVNLKKAVEENSFKQVDGVLMDLGWSMPQFFERGRGFSFNPVNSEGEPLDMRFDTNNSTTAADIIKNSNKEELAGIFKKFGEEKFSREIASAIVTARKKNPIETTGQLNEIILDVYRTKLQTEKEVPWVGGLHPATKVYQALRVAVNRELEMLSMSLPQAIEVLAPQGRLAVITFHSLEDRIVKQYFQTLGDKCVVINKKPIIAGEEELKNNPRARSAKLRIIEKK
ncbi:MAG: 16S rRNA (cytosine(1402)-N(4))-methyltransferase [Candidatus Magasanikbacteria bacterium CG10_big_fil_rev_8_21_14_0_10_36_32]|uniref:Ribosomal RNA small subunit methyltransferase H n=1 Tax=Candidatus Magasanikbacteria bacterium CG10_big_fil_rev_8_21_14_0_10_36_32 TaxID=1974646 RepID=A0A2M6W6A2_9BACT|nr:MAG: 16S rRNA (cytosine(1402)-N(4))-methyltransferase [Candidatus Magasanikbacteria bacterium CG10_big_fil_rev_8_21_14_0_10_36_32]